MSGTRCGSRYPRRSLASTANIPNATMISMTQAMTLTSGDGGGRYEAQNCSPRGLSHDGHDSLNSVSLSPQWGHVKSIPENSSLSCSTMPSTLDDEAGRNKPLAGGLELLPARPFAAHSRGWRRGIPATGTQARLRSLRVPGIDVRNQWGD